MILRLDKTVQTAQGQAIAGALVYFLTQPANTAALTPLANVYSNLTGTPAANPQVTDGLGQIGCYLDNAQLYTMVVVAPQIQTQIYPDQNIGAGGTSSTGRTPFAQVPQPPIDASGNRVFTLTVSPTLLLLNYNQGVLVPGVGYTTAVVGGVYTITLAIAPQVGDVLYASGLV